MASEELIQRVSRVYTPRSRERAMAASSSCVRRPVASASHAAAVASVSHPAAGEPEPGPWYAGRLVRLILVLLALFFVLHIALWKVVYDFILDTDHNRLHDTVQTAWTRLKETVNALD